MPTLYEFGKVSMHHHELGMIREDGTIDVWCYGYQPTTNDIAERAKRRGGTVVYTHAVQLIGNRFEVYDLSTLRRAVVGIRSEDYTIGLPVAVNENLDAAIMAAMLLS